MDNPETLATLGTQDTRRRQKHNTTQKAKKMSNTNPTKKAVFLSLFVGVTVIASNIPFGVRSCTFHSSLGNGI
jgi:hypothetical protein